MKKQAWFFQTDGLSYGEYPNAALGAVLARAEAGGARGSRRCGSICRHRSRAPRAAAAAPSPSGAALSKRDTGNSTWISSPAILSASL